MVAAFTLPQQRHPLVSPAPRSSLFSPILSPSISAASYSISPIPLSPDFQSFLLSAPSTASPPDELSTPSPLSIGESVAVVVDRPASQPRKRRRLTEAQLRGRREKQRHADLQRREREHTALSRLHALLTANAERKQRVDDEAEEGDEAKTRADLLEESVDCINQLQLLVAQLTSACNQYQSNDRGLPAKRPLPQSLLASSSAADIDNLPPSASSFVAAHIRRLSLNPSMFTRSPVCVVIMHVPSGVIADASDSYLCHTRWQRSHLVGRRMFPPLETMVQEPMHLTNPHSDIMRDDRTLVQAEDGRVVHSRQEPQYESSLLLAQQLLTG